MARRLLGRGHWTAAARCPTGLFARAEKLIAERRFDEAISFCQLQLAASPRCVTLRLLAARARLACGDRAGARAELEQCLRIDPANAEARALWGESIAPAPRAPEPPPKVVVEKLPNLPPNAAFVPREVAPELPSLVGDIDGMFEPDEPTQVRWEPPPSPLVPPAAGRGRVVDEAPRRSSPARATVDASPRASEPRASAARSSSAPRRPRATPVVAPLPAPPRPRPTPQPARVEGPTQHARPNAASPPARSPSAQPATAPARQPATSFAERHAQSYAASHAPSTTSHAPSTASHAPSYAMSHAPSTAAARPSTGAARAPSTCARMPSPAAEPAPPPRAARPTPAASPLPPPPHPTPLAPTPLPPPPSSPRPAARASAFLAEPTLLPSPLPPPPASFTPPSLTMPEPLALGSVTPAPATTPERLGPPPARVERRQRRRDAFAVRVDPTPHRPSRWQRPLRIEARRPRTLPRAALIAMMLLAAVGLWRLRGGERVPLPATVIAPPSPPPVSRPTPEPPVASFDRAQLDTLLGDVWIHPLRGPERRMPIRDSRLFGAERLGDRPSECRGGHCGIDLGGRYGEPVFAVHDGIIDRVQRAPNPDHGGHYVRIAHRGGTIVTQYFHLSEIPRRLVEGMTIKAGEVVGWVGLSGIKHSEPHLHFTVSVQEPDGSDARYIDPEPLVALWPLRVSDKNDDRLRLSTAPPGLARGFIRRRHRHSHDELAAE